MHKMLRYLMMAVLACFFMVPALSSEAATVAFVAPVIKGKDADVSYLTQVYYDRAINAVKNQGVYTIVDNGTLDEIIAKNTTKDVAPTEVQLRTISDKANVDLVLGVQIDEYETIPVLGTRENRIRLVIKGKTVYYNRIENKFTDHLIWVDNEIDEVFTSRWDPLKEEFGREMSREVNKAIKNKKLNLETPKMSKL